MSAFKVSEAIQPCKGCSQSFPVSVLSVEGLCASCAELKGSKSLGFLWLRLAVEE